MASGVRRLALLGCLAALAVASASDDGREDLQDPQRVLKFCAAAAPRCSGEADGTAAKAARTAPAPAATQSAGGDIHASFLGRLRSKLAVLEGELPKQAGGAATQKGRHLLAAVGDAEQPLSFPRHFYTAFGHGISKLEEASAEVISHVESRICRVYTTMCSGQALRAARRRSSLAAAQVPPADVLAAQDAVETMGVIAKTEERMAMEQATIERLKREKAKRFSIPPITTSEATRRGRRDERAAARIREVHQATLREEAASHRSPLPAGQVEPAAPTPRGGGRSDWAHPRRPAHKPREIGALGGQGRQATRDWAQTRREAEALMPSDVMRPKGETAMGRYPSDVRAPTPVREVPGAGGAALGAGSKQGLAAEVPGVEGAALGAGAKQGLAAKEEEEPTEAVTHHLAKPPRTGVVTTAPALNIVQYFYQPSSRHTRRPMHGWSLVVFLFWCAACSNRIPPW